MLLQPWMRFELTAPDARPHELRSDLAQHGAYIEWGDGYQVRGRVPLAEIPRLRSALHARAPGRGVVTFEFDSHDPVPEPLATSIRETRAAQIRARLEGMSFWDRFPLLDRLG
ncbi:MAG TPA: hypothetical protein VFF73_04650 [Planctomycetota bacterium]|nr:hypothetical protein [Planctomycetota bacterium]